MDVHSPICHWSTAGWTWSSVPTIRCHLPETSRYDVKTSPTGQGGGNRGSVCPLLKRTPGSLVHVTSSDDTAEKTCQPQHTLLPAAYSIRQPGASCLGRMIMFSNPCPCWSQISLACVRVRPAYVKWTPSEETARCMSARVWPVESGLVLYTAK